MRMHHSQHDVFGDRRPESGHPLRKPLGHAAYLQRQSAVPDGFIKTIINLMGRIVKVTADTIRGMGGKCCGSKIFQGEWKSDDWQSVS